MPLVSAAGLMTAVQPAANAGANDLINKVAAMKYAYRTAITGVNCFG